MWYQEHEVLEHFKWTTGQLRSFRQRFLTEGVEYVNVKGLKKAMYDIEGVNKCLQNLAIRASTRINPARSTSSLRSASVASESVLNGRSTSRRPRPATVRRLRSVREDGSEY